MLCFGLFLSSPIFTENADLFVLFLLKPNIQILLREFCQQLLRINGTLNLHIDLRQDDFIQERCIYGTTQVFCVIRISFTVKVICSIN